MHCPRCEVEVLEERAREGVNIDVCHTCRGVWLDRGELERLIVRAEEPRGERSREERGGRDDRRRDGDDRRRDDRRGHDDDDDDDNNRGRGGFFSTLRNLFD